MKRTVAASLAAVGLLLLAAWARCTGWANVFTPHGVELIPTDSHYHVRFALLQLHAFPRFVSFDPYVNFPEGAHIYWAPLHAWLVALAIRLGGVHQPELGAAFVGPAIAVIEIAVIGLLARRWHGWPTALASMLLLALLPVTVESSELGEVDHHVHEWFLIAAAALVQARALSMRSDRLAVIAGLVLAGGRFLNPTSTVLFTPTLAFAFVAAAVLARRTELPRQAALMGASCAALLALGSAAFGKPLSLFYESFSAFHPVLAIACFGGAAGLAGVLAGSRRWALCLLLPVGCAALLSGEIARALGHLGRADPILSVMMESAPLAKDPRWALRLFGAALLLLPIAFALAAREAWRSREPALLPALAVTFALSICAAAQARFSQPLAGAVAVLLPLGLAPLARSSRLGAAALGACALSLFPVLLPRPLATRPSDEALARPTLLWLRDHTPPASDPLRTDERPAYAVIGYYELGHLLTLWAERPTVSSPFSQAPWHVAGNERASRVLAATDDEEAYQRAVETGARYVVATPFRAILGHLDVQEDATLAARLLNDAGMGGSGTAHFRLIHDSAEQRLRPHGGSFGRVFEVVPGALLRGRAPPGSDVVATLPLADNLGAPLRYERRTTATAGGTFSLRVAYPTRTRSEVHALDDGGYQIRWPGGAAQAQVSEEDVARGAALDL